MDKLELYLNKMLNKNHIEATIVSVEELLMAKMTLLTR